MRSVLRGNGSPTVARLRVLLCILLLGACAACSSDSDDEGGGGRAVGGSGGSGGAGGDGGNGGEVGVAFIRLREGEAAVAEHHSVAFAAEAVDIRGERLAGAAFSWRSSDEAIATVDERGVATGHRPGWARIVASLGDVEAAVLLQVRGGEVATVEVTPSRRSLGLGESLQLEAVALDSKERPLHVETVEWVSRDPAIASISPEGLVHTHGTGATRIVAKVAGVEGSARLEVRLQFVDVAVGAEHTCARVADGSTLCWGDNTSGALGAGLGVDVAPHPMPALGASFTQIALGYRFGCGLGREGEVWCWGVNDDLSLGREDVRWNAVPMPTAWSEPRFRSIVSGNYHLCGLDEGGHAWCWGYNSPDGELGQPDTSDSALPLRVSAPADGEDPLVFEELRAGRHHTCGRTAERRLFCWGFNSDGQLGDGSSTSRWRPVETMQGHEVQAFDLGDAHSCALTTEGRLFCWGDNGDWQLGQENKGIYYLTPVEVDTEGKTFASLALGEDHSCALDGEGRAWCWGQNVSGELGNGTVADSRTPVQVAGDHRFILLDSKLEHTCGLVSKGDVFCWGDNWWGQLGNGAVKSTSTAPVQVVEAPPPAE